MLRRKENRINRKRIKYCDRHSKLEAQLNLFDWKPKDKIKDKPRLSEREIIEKIDGALGDSMEYVSVEIEGNTIYLNYYNEYDGEDNKVNEDFDVEYNPDKLDDAIKKIEKWVMKCDDKVEELRPSEENALEILENDDELQDLFDWCSDYGKCEIVRADPIEANYNNRKQQDYYFTLSFTGIKDGKKLFTKKERFLIPEDSHNDYYRNLGIYSDIKSWLNSCCDEVEEA